jgi:hypothetical protein
MLSLGRLAHRVQRVWCRGVATFAVGLNSGRWDSATRRTLPATAIKLSNGRLQCDQTDRNPPCLILVPPLVSPAGSAEVRAREAAILLIV